MATRVTVNIPDRAVISALNTPGGAVYEWRDEIGRAVVRQAHATSPVNDPLDALHRGGVVGTYAASWDWDRIGSNGHQVRATVTNSADHAVYVEEGRRAANAPQTFSWTRWQGDIRTTGRTGRRPGRHVLARALVAVMGAQGMPGVALQHRRDKEVGMREFKNAARSAEAVPNPVEVTFLIEGRDIPFVANPPTSGQVALFMARQAEGSSHAERVASVFTLLRSVLGAEDYVWIEASLDNGTLDAEVLLEVMEYLVEEWTARPTPPASDLSPTRRTTGRSSTGRARSAALTSSP